ncbi:DNA-directed RNA polymerase III subunit RPC3-like isoform X2 [Dreissena polymorpha]|uniref:DNA-directed RNA polymerase III subunit RPC3-like isoform X2 n=1 Tax=Dreissena polymorpha TaxID=45954 RepID=UPI002265309A|nr:DNA-directed RNA polymerase III subunit RPC3-like isoform X2 [Dreissena polymorpha]
MSNCKSSICSHLIKDHFGDLTQTVKHVLTVLIQNNLVTFQKNKRGQTEYTLDHDAILWRNRIPHYIFCGKNLYGDAAELLIEDIAHNGQITMSTVVENVTDKLNEALENAGHPKIGASVVYEKFKALANTHFIKQCVNPLETLCPEDIDECAVAKLYTVPPFQPGNRKRKLASDEEAQPVNKKIKTEAGASAADDHIYWTINNNRFHRYFTDQLLIKAIRSKIDERAGQILQTILRLNEVMTEDLALTSNPVSFIEIFQALPKDLQLSKQICEQYLTVMADDSTGFVNKIGDSGGGMYTINMMKAMTTICTAHVESVIQERFGSKSLRIFRVLILKKHLEQKQIEELVMIPAKEAKELLYNMFAQNFITITEISKTADHAPARSFYLFRVNLEQVARMLLEHSMKALMNTIVKREMETRENRRLMEKEERAEAIIANLERSGGDAEQKEEILQSITPAEKTQLKRVKHMINMLDQCELQLDETIFVLETYLQYCETKLKTKR